MLRLAIKILMGDRAKYIGMILGLTFASFIITQQAAIFLGLMSRTFGFVTDTRQVDVWVMDSEVEFVDDVKPLKDTKLFKVRGIDGVEWAMPLFKGLIKARLPNGRYQTCNVIGVDAGTFIGGPPSMLEGKISDLRLVDGVIVNKVGAEDKLAREEGDQKIPLQIGDVFEVNDHRSRVVGVCEVSRTFQSQPVIYTTYQRAISFSPPERKLLSYILVKAKPGASKKELCAKINALTGLAAYTSKEFSRLTVGYFLEKTGILINFGFAVILGFIIGAAIAGQTFYNFILDNLRYLAVFKAMGTQGNMLVKMTLVQVLWVGLLGWALGTGGAAIFGIISSGTELSFLLTPQLYLLSLAAMLCICLFSALIGLIKIFRMQTGMVFKT